MLISERSWQGSLFIVVVVFPGPAALKWPGADFLFSPFFYANMLLILLVLNDLKRLTLSLGQVDGAIPLLLLVTEIGN